MSRTNNTTKIAIKTLADFLFKSIESSQNTLNQSYNKNHNKRNLFANYLLGKHSVSATDVLKSIDKPDKITDIINNMKASLNPRPASMPKIITVDIINNTLRKLDELLAAATESKSVSDVSKITTTSMNNNNISKYDIRKYDELIKNGILDAIFGSDTKGHNSGTKAAERRKLAYAMNDFNLSTEQLTQITNVISDQEKKQVIYDKVNLYKSRNNLNLNNKKIDKLIEKYLDDQRNIYTIIVNTLIREAYPTDQNRKQNIPFANQKQFEAYIKTDDVPVTDVLFFSKEQIKAMLDVVAKNDFNLPHSVTQRLTKKLEALRNERAAKNALNNLNKSLSAEEKAIADKEESALRIEHTTENALKKLSESLNAAEKEASDTNLKNVFDNNDLHTFIKKYMPEQTALLLRSLTLTEDNTDNNKKVTKFITIITTIKANADTIADKIKELLKNKHGLSTNKTNDDIINQLIQHYKTKYCNVTPDTPLGDSGLRIEYTQLTKREASVGGAKCRTKRRKLSKRLQTKKRRV
jgi:hypothetical protein